jgi:PAS domain S-box-containing protein
MKEQHKTREQLIEESVEMHQRIAEWEASEAERKQVEEALRESEEHYRSMVESIDLGMNLIDCDHNLVMVNAAQGRHFNKPPHEMIGKKCFRELEKRDAVCPHCPGVEAIATGRPAEVETHGVRDDGSRFNVRLRAFPTFRQDGTVRGFVEIGQDITKRKRAEAERKRAEEALAEEHNLLRTLIDNLPDYIYVKDTEGRFVIGNTAVVRQMGLTDLDELIGKSDFDFFPQELAERYYAEEQAIIQSGQALYDCEGPTIDTSKGEKNRWISMTKVPLRDAQGEMAGFVGLGRDITERKRAEEKIEHLNLVLRAIRNVNQLITRERDRGRLLQGACETLIETRGYHSAWIALLDESGGLVTTAEAGLGEDFLPLVERLTRGELTDCGRRALKQSGGVVTEDPSSTCADCPLSSMYDGRGAVTIRLEYGGKVYGLLSVSIPRDLAADEEEQALFEEVAGDIGFALHKIELEEERKRAVEALRDEKALVDALMDNIPDSIYFKDRQCRLIRINRKMMRDLNLDDMSQAVGKTDVDLFGEEFGQKTLAEDQRIMTTGEPIIGLIESRQLEDGQSNWTSTTKVALRDASGQIVGVVGITREINELMRAREALKQYSERLEEMVEERTKELREAQEQLVRQEKLAVLGQLAGGVGHELRNPLGAIKSAAYFLNMALEEPDPEVKETLEILEKEVATSENVISSLLDFARAKPPTRRRVDTNEVIQEALSRVTVPENVEVVSQLDGRLPAILADPDQLGQVFGNIILNAVQAMPEGGQLTIKSEVPSAEWVAVSFTDTGAGIPEENLDKLFEPLFTTKAKGIGLGLAVTKTLVEGHGGSIEVESEVGVGTTFMVRLPMSGS